MAEENAGQAAQERPPWRRALVKDPRAWFSYFLIVSGFFWFLVEVFHTAEFLVNLGTHGFNPLWLVVAGIVGLAFVIYWAQKNAAKKPKAAETQANPVKPPADPSSFSANVRIFEVSIPLGEVRETPGGLRIEVRSIDELAAESVATERQAGREYEAELSVDTPLGIGSPHYGTKTRKTGYNRYYLPVKGLEHIEPGSLYSLRFSERHIAGFMIYIDHINPHSKVVTIKGCIFTTHSWRQ